MIPKDLQIPKTLQIPKESSKDIDQRSESSQDIDTNPKDSIRSELIRSESGYCIKKIEKSIILIFQIVFNYEIS